MRSDGLHIIEVGLRFQENGLKTLIAHASVC